MFRSRLQAALAGFASVLALASWSPDVAACTPPPNGWFAIPESLELPSDGYLIFSMSCYVNCSPGPGEPTITVRDESSGDEVSGSVAPLPDVDASLHVYGWRATSPLVAGDYYTVQFFSSFASEPVPITVVPSGTPSLNSLDIQPDVHPAETAAGEKICCPGGPLDSCGGHYCFYDKLERSVGILLDWSVTTEAALWTQYLHRVTWDGAEPEPWSAGLGAYASFDTARTEYCYTLELRSLIDDSVERLERTCLEHPAGLDVGEFDVDPVTLRRSLGVCEEPPEGEEAAWCEARAERCAEFPTEPCNDLERLCREQPPDGGTGGHGGENGGDSPTGPRQIRTEGCGCRVVTASDERRGFAFALGLLAVGLVARRRAR